MFIVSAILVIALAYYATTISHKRAADYTAGASEPSTVAPGSGEFFDPLAHRYDLLNQIISFGFHSSWRRSALNKILPASSVLDVSTGTADLAITIAANRSVRVVGLDPSTQMLNVGRRKVQQTSALIGSVELVEGVAEALPFGDESFDAVVVAFGVRNFQDRKKGLQEMSRVLKTGGKLAILELSLPEDTGIINRCVRLFVIHFMPKLAALVAGKEAAYQYLSDSMASFPNPAEFSKMLEDSGVIVSTHERLPPFGTGPDLYAAHKPVVDSDNGR